MIVCSCNVLSDGDVRACLSPGAACPRTPSQVYECLGCSPQCGSCARTIRSIISSALAQARDAEDHSGCRVGCGVACPLGAKTADHSFALAP